MNQNEEHNISLITGRPLSITLIALFQFFRAGIILLIVLCLWIFPDANLSSRIDVKVLTYITARQPLPPAFLVPIVMPVVAAYLAVTGFGLWFLKKWARNILMITSAVTSLMWIRGFMFYGALGEPLLETEMQRQTVLVVIMLDLLVFAYLFLEGKAFGEKD